MNTANEQLTQPLLTVAVPTYNRAVYLRQMLPGICGEAVAETDVEVLVSGNGSPDDTPAAVEEARTASGLGDRLRYHRHERNLGLDANFSSLIANARGRFLWTLCDDDRSVPGALPEVLAILRRRPDLAFLQLNYSLYDRELRECQKERGMELVEDRYWEDGREAAAFILGDAVRASCLVMRRELVHGPLVDRYEKELTGHLCLVLAYALTAMARGPAACAARPLFLYRGDNQAWIKLWPLIASVYMPMVFRDAVELCGHPRSTSVLLREHYRGHLHGLLLHLRMSEDEELRRRFQPGEVFRLYADRPWFWARAAWVLLLPGVFWRGLRAVKRMLRPGTAIPAVP